MNPILPLLLAGSMLAMAACSTPEAPGAPANPSAIATTAPTPTPAPTAPEPAATPDAPGSPAATTGEAQAGWYMEHGEMGMFQLCGQQAQLTVESAELRQRARDFGLEPNMPVYVRLSGTSDGTSFTVTRIDQFGSPEPVRDCGMTGTMTPSQ